MKISYVAQIGATGLSSNKKSYRHSRGPNYDLIVTKIGTHVCIIKLQIKFENELCGANRRGRTFLEFFVVSRSRGGNFDSFFFIKL